MNPRSRALLLALFALAVAARAVHLSELSADPLFRAPTLDALYHQHHARGLALGDWSLPDGVPDPEVRTTPWHRPPGYPLALVPLYAALDSPWTPRVAQALVGLLAGLLAFALARRARPDDETAPLVAAAFVWLSPLQLLFETELQAATLTGLLLLGLAWLALRLHARRDLAQAALFGALLGVAVLVRPNTAPLGLLALPAALAHARASSRARATLLVVVPAVLSLAIASVVPLRNAQVAGQAILTSTNGPVSMLFANHDDADGVENVPPGHAPFTGVQALSPFGYPRFKRTVENNLGRALSFRELSSLCTHHVHRFLASHPGDFLALTGKRVALLLGPRSVGNNREVAVVFSERAALAAAPARFFLLFPLALAGLAWLLARRREEGARAGLYVAGAGLLYLLPLTLFFAGSRFRAPLVPLLAVLAGVGAAALVRAARERAFPRAAVLGLALGACTWLAAPLAPAPKPARHHIQRAVAWQTLGERDRARAELERATKLGGATTDGAVTLGYLELEAGRAQEAERAFRTALSSAPDDVAALAGLGAALVQLGRARDATAPLERATKRDATHETALYNLGLARFAARDAPGAIAAYEALLAAHPDHHRGRTNLARTYLALGEPARAIPLLDEVLRAVPGDRNAAFNRAIALDKSGRPDDAVAAYRDILARAPDDVSALTNLGVILRRTDPLAASEPLARAAELAPAHAGVQLNLVTTLLAAGDVARARHALDRALSRAAPREQQALRDAERRWCAAPEPPPAPFCPSE